MVSVTSPSLGGYFDLWRPLTSEPHGVLMVMSPIPKCPRQKPSRPATWCRASNMPGFFEPDDVSMKVEGDQITLHGVHKYEHDGDGSDKIECTRHVTLSEGVDPSSVKLIWNRGRLYVKGDWTQAEKDDSHSDENGRDVPITNQRRENVGEAAVPEKKPLDFDLDLSDYKPEEIKVKLSGNKLIVAAEQKTEDENNVQAQHFYRLITVADHIDTNQLKTVLAENGMLHVSAPLLQQTEGIESPTEIPGDEQPETEMESGR